MVWAIIACNARNPITWRKPPRCASIVGLDCVCAGRLALNLRPDIAPHALVVGQFITLFDGRIGFFGCCADIPDAVTHSQRDWNHDETDQRPDNDQASR